MTNFEAVTKSSESLANFLEAVQEDALEAEGCSIKLTLPDGDCIDWEAWLKSECSDPDGVMCIHGQWI